MKFPKPTKKTSRIRRSVALKRADDAFSAFIRNRDGNQCVTCGKHFKHIEAGHWIPRGHESVRYDERNVHSQCRRCNQYLGGNPVKYRKFMLDNYGKEVVEELELKSQVTVHRKTEDLLVIETHYKEKLHGHMGT